MAVAVPNFAQTAQTQADLNNAATDKTNLNNRVNQVNATGDQLTWTTGPDGRPVQTVTAGAQGQALQNNQFGVQNQAGQLTSGLLGQAQGSMGTPMDTSGLTGWNPNQLDPGFGAVQQVKDDYLNLMKPEQEQEQQQMAAMLKNRGIPMNSEAWQAGMRQLGDRSARRGWEATDKATSAYNDIFQRGLAGNNQANATRQAQFGELTALRDQPLKEATAASGLMGVAGDPKFNSYLSSGNYVAPDLMKAEADTYAANVNNSNAKEKKKSGLLGGLLGVAGSALGGPLGGMAGKAIGSLFS
jgi:hypothetical protein